MADWNMERKHPLKVDPVPNVIIKRGPLRSFLVTKPSEDLSSLRSVTSSKEKFLVAFLLVFAAAVRLHNISLPSSVVFDEHRIGNSVSHYLKKTFLADFNPPLVSMLYSGVASIFGYDGSFSFFHIGVEYPSNVPYIAMRFFSATLGILSVLVLYLTLRVSGVKIAVAAICTVCFVIENSFVTLSRYALLEGPFLFFIACAVYFFRKSELYLPNSCKANKSLIASSIALGFAVSSKWAGLFTIAWAGVIVLWRLWFMIGDLSRPIGPSIKYMVFQITCLLSIPAFIYILVFFIHIKTLSLNGTSSSFFPAEFRTSLENNNVLKETVAEVGVGSAVSLNHIGTVGGYLHSHLHNYPAGSMQQQITLYPHIDQNNKWVIELADHPNENITSFQNLTDGTIIRLRHLRNSCRLHSHDHKPPVSQKADWQKEVSCYGYDDFDGDINDDWIIEIDKKRSAPGPAQERIRAIETKFRLKHYLTGCYLFSHYEKLPEWGFGQQEVTCAYFAREDLTSWYIEENDNEAPLPNPEKVSYAKMGFWQKFIAIHKFISSAGDSLDLSYVYSSEPKTWPFMLRGIDFWNEKNKEVYFLGNAVLWWSVTGFICMFIAGVAIELLAWKLGTKILQDAYIINFHYQVMQYLLGFALHYVPFYFMKHNLFLYDYIPAYYFGILAFGHALDLISTYLFNKKSHIGYVIVIIFMLACFYFFYDHSPLIYASEWTSGLCKRSKWLGSWDFYCNSFFPTYSHYE
ncbi:Dolichyl-phosphate-mannose--protein mannosyltransferase 5 [Saccharomyces pastorianus]|uniref:Dolichyl-phosphate-mannose--protein mannosyltransferase n=1 Tax=Saccharomyces pastorianus TaxID=27292 RepID=A0A6C1E491_SACPS|nr:Dolichyl-phosphate-mannose--protein mannosyltransferase 5 [Saccharomyces pastorianus]